MAINQQNLSPIELLPTELVQQISDYLVGDNTAYPQDGSFVYDGLLEFRRSSETIRSKVHSVLGETLTTCMVRLDTQDLLCFIDIVLTSNIGLAIRRLIVQPPPHPQDRFLVPFPSHKPVVDRVLEQVPELLSAIRHRPAYVVLLMMVFARLPNLLHVVTTPILQCKPMQYSDGDVFSESSPGATVLTAFALACTEHRLTHLSIASGGAYGSYRGVETDVLGHFLGTTEQDCLRNLTVLNLTLSATRGDFSGNLQLENGLVSILWNATQLTTIILSFDDDTHRAAKRANTMALFQSIANLHFPRLKMLHLIGWKMTESQLTTFFDTHKDALVDISFYCCDLLGSWKAALLPLMNSTTMNLLDLVLLTESDCRIAFPTTSPPLLEREVEDDSELGDWVWIPEIVYRWCTTIAVGYDSWQTSLRVVLEDMTNTNNLNALSREDYLAWEP